MSKHTLYIVLGLMAAVVAIQMHNLDLKYLIAILAGAFLILLSFIIGDSGRLAYLFLVLFALSIPLNLDVNLFYRPHIGGAPGISISLTFMAVAMLYILWFYRYRTSEKKVFCANRPLLWATILYMAAGTLSFINADYTELVFFQLVRLVLLFLVFFFTMNLKDEKHIRIFIFFLSAGVLVEGILAVVQYKTNTSLGLQIFGEERLVEQNLGYMVSRATGTIGHPNALGYYFEILIPLVFAMFLVERKRLYQRWYLIVLIFSLAGILTTLSRGAWITLPISLAMVFFTLFGNRLLRIKSAIGMFIFGLIALIALYFAYPTIEKRLVHDDYRSAESRMPLNKAAVSIINKFPLVGVGLNNFSEVFKRYDTTGNSRIFRGYKHVVHNLYLLVWAEVGTIGLIAFLWIFVSSFIIIARLLFKVPLWYRGILTGIAAGLFA
ncbi:MAG: O-antigen ligase family protein, partial [Nitrospirae bacterium]|nr:O-antigen ligase family protein [Nitrospirota bacterium]